jgi:CRP-like cAMP-binding protein
MLPGGRRFIADLLLPGEFYGFNYLVIARPQHDLVALGTVGYRALRQDEVRALMASQPAVGVRVAAHLAEMCIRTDRQAALRRFDARERIAALLLDVYDRLRGRKLIHGLSFNLSMTQEDIGDHLGLTMVHVNRTLRKLRGERLVHIDRHVVMIMDLVGLRALVEGCRPSPNR